MACRTILTLGVMTQQGPRDPEPELPPIDLDQIIAKVLADTLSLTACCWGYDTYWGDLHVCRRCEAPNPVMVDVPRADAEARWASQEGA